MNYFCTNPLSDFEFHDARFEVESIENRTLKTAIVLGAQHMRTICLFY